MKSSLGEIARNKEAWSPVPRVVTPGASPGEAPSDALILFDGENGAEWVSADHPDQPAQWKVEDGLLTVDKKAGNIQTRRSFTDFQLHLEWSVPVTITGTGQQRGNSGLFLGSTGPDNAGYEIQILDSFNNPTYVNGMAGSLYKQAIPLVNPSHPPGDWQVYDVIWTAPRFGPDGLLSNPARVTLLYNGVLVLYHAEVQGETSLPYPVYQKHGPLPIMLQAHKDPSEPISFRNIWIREL
ncbi:DUF1080 domain-containing protein [Paraflavisolibacter sp. H34]|uniref:3-keto-disaccharide hydrolase n=1 Tax=Huijunlia imazamoxiresistens TaxID=3127457 RepID=UPI0030179D28